MFISKQFSSALVYSACSAALLTMVGCSDGGSEKAGPAVQPQQSMTGGTIAAAPGASNTQNAQAGRNFSGTTRGRVSAVNADGSVEVLGQTIAVSTGTVYFGIARTEIMVGDYVSIDGSVDGSGRIVAGAITLDTSFDPVVTLMGVVSNVDVNEQTFQVGDVTVGFDALNFNNFDVANLSNGMVVEIAANEQNFDAGFSQVAVDSISVLENGSIVNVGPNGIFVDDGEDKVIIDNNGIQVSGSEGTTVVGANGIITHSGGDSIVIGENGVSVNADGNIVVGPDGVFVSVDGETVVVGQNGVSINADGTVVVDNGGVTVTDGDGTTSVTSDGIAIDGVDLEDFINDTINNSLEGVLDLGDLSAYDYTDIELSASSNCLSVGVPTAFQITGNTTNAMSEAVTHNLSGQVSVNSDSTGNLNLVANNSAGIYLNMTEQDIIEMEIVAGDTTLTHYVGALPSSVARPVVLAKQTANWCSFIFFEQDNCTSITNTTEAYSVNAGQASVETSPLGTTVTAGQTVVDTSSAGTTISVGGEVLIDTVSNQWVSEEGVIDSVSIHSGVTVNGCNLNNPAGIPVITVQ